MMEKKLIVLLILLTGLYSAKGQNQEADKVHFVCNQPTGEYHDNEHCPRLQMCSGGRTRKIKNIQAGLTPCKKCVKKVAPVKGGGNGFKNIKNVLGVKDRKQISDSLGTVEGTIHRPEGFTIRITGQPGTKSVNTIDFYFDNPVTFVEDSLLSKGFFNQLGLQFERCKADTLRNTTPHPVTGKVKKDFSIEYRGCAVVEAKDKYEDTSKYYYELIFIAKEGGIKTELEKIQLVLRYDQ